MPSTASTPSLDPAPAASPSDERIPLSSVPDLTKLFAPLIQEAIELELDGEEASSAYYDEFEQLYWMYSGWDEEREDFERKWDPLMDWKGLMKESADLAPKFALMNGRPRGPAGLAILRKRHFARHPVLDPAQRLVSLPSLNSRRKPWNGLAESVKGAIHGLLGRPVLGI
ncbi:hypothetical protein NBRC10512v2_001463 [Rhodotorula toruloides]